MNDLLIKENIFSKKLLNFHGTTLEINRHQHIPCGAQQDERGEDGQLLAIGPYSGSIHATPPSFLFRRIAFRPWLRR